MRGGRGQRFQAQARWVGGANAGRAAAWRRLIFAGRLGRVKVLRRRLVRSLAPPGLHHDARGPGAIVPVNRDGTFAVGLGFSGRAHKNQGSGLLTCTDLLQLQMRLVLPPNASWIHKSYEPGLLVGLDEL